MAISSIWKIRNKTKGGAFVSFDSAGITGAKGRFVSMAIDTVNITLVQPYDAAHNWSYKDEVEIQRNGALWYSGVITTNPRTGTPNSESYSFTLSGAWWWLEQTTYMVQWKSGEIPPAPANPNDPPAPLITSDEWMSQARLFVDPNGVKVSLKKTIEQLFQFATAEAKLPLQLGTIVDTVIPWPSEAKDVTIAQLIRRVMQWSPSTLMQVDYSTSPPTCNFIKRAAAPVYTVDLNQKHFITSNSIQSRDDLKPTSVCLSYEFDNQYNDKTFRNVVQDIAPLGANCLLPGSVNLTIPMRGFRKMTEIVRVRTAKIPDNPKRIDPNNVPIGETNGTLSSNDVTVNLGVASAGSGRRWWLRHHAELKEYDHDKILIDVEPGVAANPAANPPVEAVPATYTFSQDLPDDDPPEPLSKFPSKLRSSPTLGSTTPLIEEFPRELVVGQVDEWMGVKARDIDVNAKIYYMGSDADFAKLSDEKKAQWPHTQDTAKKVKTEDGETDVQGKRYTVATNTIVATNALTENYVRTTTAIGTESQPQNLAAHYLAEHSELHWQGSLTATTDEVDQQTRLGSVLNLTNGHAAWTNMRAQIQNVSVDLNTGTTVWTFGPPNHLSIQDRLTQLKLEKESPLAPEIASSEVEYDPATGTAKIDKTVGGYQGPKAKGKLGGGGGGDSCTNLKVTLTANGNAHDLAVTPGTVDTTTLMHTSSITAPTKVWIVVDGSAGVKENPAGSGNFEYDGTVTLSNHRILVQVADPTSIPSAAPTSASNVAMVYAMLSADIYDDNGTLKIRAAKCGDRVTKWCPPQSFYFNPT